jgi:hypothetical protein
VMPSASHTLRIPAGSRVYSKWLRTQRRAQLLRYGAIAHCLAEGGRRRSIQQLDSDKA